MVNLLFLCTHNSARSVLGEVVTNKIGAGIFTAYSAGSTPSGRVNPFAIEVAAQLGVSADTLHSKSWDEFSKPDAPNIDVVITVCDSAANEVCPIWPGHPITVHWGLEDPSNLEGDEKKREGFKQVALEIERRIKAVLGEFTSDLDHTQLKQLFNKVIDS